MKDRQRAVIYTRQSLDVSGEGLAVQRQRDDCTRLAEARGWEVVRQHDDNDRSASGKTKRPGFESLLADICDGRADVIVAWSLDRLTRNRRDQLRLIEACEARGTLIALVRGADIDMGTPAGRLVSDVLAGVARHEIEQKGDRQRRAEQQRAEHGRPAAGGRRPFGYQRGGLLIDESEAPMVQQAVVDILAGASLKSIAKRWNDAGVATTAGGTWRHDNVREVLKNPRYAGLRAYRGTIVGEAVWPALVSRDDYDAVQALLSRPERRTTSGTARKYLLPGLAYCWKCGSDVATGHTRHGKRVYVCRANKCVSRKADPVDFYVAGVLLDRFSRPDAVELLVNRADDVMDHRAKADTIRQRIDDLATALGEGALTLSAVRKASERLRGELAETEAKIAAAAHADALGPLLAARDIDATWGNYDLQQRREVIEALMTITLLSPERGRRDFDPDSVRIEWKAARDED